MNEYERQGWYIAGRTEQDNDAEIMRRNVDAQIAHDEGADITDGATDDEK